MKKGIVKIIFILIFVSLLINPALHAKKNAGSIDLKGFSKFVDTMLKEWDVPGAAVAIVKDGKVVYAEGFGYRDMEKKLKVTPDTLFAIGSCTKAFTATVLGILVDEGKLEWDKPVREYLPTFKLQDTFASEQMTPMDLVTHRSGLPRHDPAWFGSTATREELFNRLQYMEPTKGFRTTYQYNNLMFMTAGYMAGKIAGTTWEELVRSHTLADYTGKFENPGYGIITVGKDGESLTAVFNGIDYKVEHYHYDIFDLSTEISPGQKIKASFHIDLKGNINSITIPLQGGVKDIEFTRLPEKKVK